MKSIRVRSSAVAVRLRALKESKSLTYDQLAELLGVNRITAWRWCMGLSIPRGKAQISVIDKLLKKR